MDTSTILTNLKKISDESGSEFLDLSANFPVLVSELSFSKKAEGEAAHTEKLSKFTKIQTGLNASLEKQKHILEQNDEVVEKFKVRNEELVDSFVNRMELLQKMNEIIQNIKDESNEMELISLNAMVVSIKSGKEGQAFSYITSNLKSLSQRLISQSDVLIMNEKTVQDHIAQLKQTINEIESISNKSSQAGAESSGEEIKRVIEQIMASLTEMLNHAAEVKEPIIKAMECIQMQDIIRQSLDDVILTISKIIEPSNFFSVEEKLDQYTFNEQLSEVSANLLNHIKEKLYTSIHVFKTNQTQINRILSDVENQKQNFVNGNKKNKSKTQELKDCIERTSKEFNKFLSIFKAYQSAQDQVLEKSSTIQNSVERIQLCFNDFFPIINNLHYVTIAQRIEVARNSNISSIESTVEYMANLIDKTNENVQSAQDVLESFIETSAKQVRQFTAKADKDRVFFSSINKEKNSFIKSLDKLQKQFTDAVKSFVVYSSDFLESYQKIELTISNLERLAKGLEAERDALILLKQNSTAEKEALLKQIGKTDWEIKNNAFNDFIHHFTIVSDKEMVGAVAGLEIESGVESGEITFF